MLVTLKRNSTNLGLTIAHQGTFCQTIVKILTGVWTQPNDLSGLNAWSTGACLFEPGSFGTTGYWSVVASVDTGVGAAGWYLLSKPSTTTSKTNYLYIAWSQSGNTLFGVATGYSGGSPVNLNTYNGGSYSSINNTANQTFYLRFTDNIAHFFSDGYGFTNSTTSTYMDILWFEFNPNDYDLYSVEGSLKLLMNNSSLYIANMYNAHHDTLLGSQVLTASNNVGGTLARVLYPSRSADLQSNSNLLVPAVFSSQSQGWLGGNVSAATGMYSTTSGFGVSGQKVTIGTNNYIIRAYGSGGLNYMCRY